MDANDPTRFRTELLGRRAEIEAELGHLESELFDLSVDQQGERGGLGNHFADDASSLGEQERIAIVGADFREEMLLIDAAVERLDDSTFGACQRCGKQIPIERLEALPFVAYCVECQTYLERQHALYGVGIRRS